MGRPQLRVECENVNLGKNFLSLGSQNVWALLEIVLLGLLVGWIVWMVMPPKTKK